MDVELYQMIPTARRVLEQTLGLKEGEKLCIVTDAERPPSITQALLCVAAYLGAEPVVVKMPPRDMGGIDPPDAVVAAMKAADAVVMQTSFATTHTRAVRESLALGVRICELWGITEDMMLRGGLLEDPDRVRELSDRIAARLDEGREGVLTTPEGSHLTVSLVGRKCIPLAHAARERGGFASLPAGEAAISPVEGTAEGVLVAPYLVEHREIARPKEPLRLVIKGGKVVEVEGGAEAGILQRLLEENGDTARNIAEFAIGTNTSCRLHVGIREAKKVWGTAHVAIGDSQTIGGLVESPLHIDFIFRRPTVLIDGEPIVKDGVIVGDEGLMAR